MSINLRIIIFIFSLVLTLVTTIVLKKGRIPEKYSLLWYFMALVIFILAVCPVVFTFFAKHMGFQTIASLIIAILFVLLIFLTMALTIIVSGQKKKTTLLIQEVSLLKSEIESNKK